MGKHTTGGGRRTTSARTAVARVTHTPVTDGSVDFGNDRFRGALTLSPFDIGTNKSGWTVKGEVQEDYISWVNEFEARHPKLGRVWGNFEGKVYATSEKAYKHFVGNHPPSNWDYADI